MTRSTVSVGSRIADVSLGAVIWPLTPCYWSLSISTRTTSLPLRTLLRLLSHDTWIRSGECNQGVSVESEDANNSQSGIDCSEWWKCRNRIVWSGKLQLLNIIFTDYFQKNLTWMFAWKMNVQGWEFHLQITIKHGTFDQCILIRWYWRCLESGLTINGDWVALALHHYNIVVHSWRPCRWWWRISQ